MKHKILFNLKTPIVEINDKCSAYDMLHTLASDCGYPRGFKSYGNEVAWKGTVKDALLDLSEQLKELKS